jgi:hypothetical protein
MLKNLDRYFFSLIIFCGAFLNSHSQTNHIAKSDDATEEPESYPIDLAGQLQVFNNGITKAEYRISLCADVPNNEQPMQVVCNSEPGHVFLILQKISGTDTISEVFGFYPRSGVPVLIFKRTKSKIRDNSRRDYDADVTKQLTAEEFDTILVKCLFYAPHIYHINKFNCYDYAVDIFNSVAGHDPIPVTHMRYPFIFGKGGSPCCIYRDLEKLKDSNSVWAPYIRFGNLVAPVSTGKINKKDK